MSYKSSLEEFFSEYAEVEEFSYSYEYDFDLRNSSTIKIGGTCLCCVFPKSILELQTIYDFLLEEEIPFSILGKGSNTLIHSKYIDRVVLDLGRNFRGIFEGSKTLMEPDTLSDFKDLSLKEGNLAGYLDNLILRVYSGTPSIMVHKYLRDNYGVENFLGISSIPGTLGGLVITNGEVYSMSISDCLISVTYLENGIFKKVLKSECDFAYRHSMFEELQDFIIVSVDLDVAKIMDFEVCSQEILKLRKTKQPKEPNIGSVFKNLPNLSIGKAVDDLGLKGKKRNSVGISSIHGNFFVNLKSPEKEGNSEDFLSLCEEVREAILKNYGENVSLEIKELK